MKINKFLIIPVVLLLAGCATTHKIKYSYITANSAPVQSTDRNAQAQLAEAASSVGHSLQSLSAIQMATHPRAKLGAPANPKAIGMAQQASLSWVGPVKPLLRKIAAASHYRLRVLGRTPAVKPIVQVNSRNQTLAAILRNVRYQVEKQATIKVYPSSRVIELRYHSN